MYRCKRRSRPHRPRVKLNEAVQQPSLLSHRRATTHELNSARTLVRIACFHRTSPRSIPGSGPCSPPSSSSLCELSGRESSLQPVIYRCHDAHLGSCLVSDPGSSKRARLAVPARPRPCVRLLESKGACTPAHPVRTSPNPEPIGPHARRPFSDSTTVSRKRSATSFSCPAFMPAGLWTSSQSPTSPTPTWTSCPLTMIPSLTSGSTLRRT